MGIRKLGPLGRPLRSSRRRQRPAPIIDEETGSECDSEGDAWLTAEHMFTPWQIQQLCGLRRRRVPAEHARASEPQGAQEDGWVVVMHLCMLGGGVLWLYRLATLWSRVVESI